MSAIIHIVDDDRSFRTALGRLMEASGFRVACYGSADEFLAHPRDTEPGCIVLDLHMPGVDGLDLQDRLQGKAPRLPIVFLTGDADIPSTVQAMKAGAVEFLEKSASSKLLLEAIERALLDYEGHRVGNDRIQAMRGLVARLTPRETDVFNLVVHGKRNKEIAFALGSSERTVKAHRRSLMEKLEVHSLAEAVAIAERLGLLNTVV